MTIDERIEALTMNLELMQITQADILEDHEKMQSEIKILLGAQVVMSDAVTKLAEAQKGLAEAQKGLTEAQKGADARMDALILTVDQIIRGGSKPQ